MQFAVFSKKVVPAHFFRRDIPDAHEINFERISERVFGDNYYLLRLEINFKPELKFGSLFLIIDSDTYFYIQHTKI